MKNPVLEHIEQDVTQEMRDKMDALCKAIAGVMDPLLGAKAWQIAAFRLHVIVPLGRDDQYRSMTLGGMAEECMPMAPALEHMMDHAATEAVGTPPDGAFTVERQGKH